MVITTSQGSLLISPHAKSAVPQKALFAWGGKRTGPVVLRGGMRGTRALHPDSRNCSNASFTWYGYASGIRVSTAVSLYGVWSTGRFCLQGDERAMLESTAVVRCSVESDSEGLHLGSRR